MGAGQGRSRRARAAYIFDVKRAVAADKSGLAEAILGAFQELGSAYSETTAVIEGDEKSFAYTLECNVLEGIKLTNVLVDGRWNLGAHFSLQENGSWTTEAFSLDPEKEEEVRSRAQGANVSAHNLENMKQDVEKITEAHEWGEAKTIVELVQDFREAQA
jgi:hypothetical protein